jgi:D-sedoheptulose 7-phosphate isomerase
MIGDRFAGGGRAHLQALRAALEDLDRDAPRLDRWGLRLADVLVRGGRLLAAGNGGSAAQAQHLTSELVGRYRVERPPLSAIALCTEPSALTAISNDYGVEEVFCRQVRAHGRPGDVLVALSTSGSSPNVLAAVDVANACGMEVWGLTGRPGNPLAEACDDALCVDTPETATVQEVHLIAVHMICESVDRAVARVTAVAG